MLYVVWDLVSMGTQSSKSALLSIFGSLVWVVHRAMRDIGHVRYFRKGSSHKKSMNRSRKLFVTTNLSCARSCLNEVNTRARSARALVLEKRNREWGKESASWPVERETLGISVFEPNRFAWRFGEKLDMFNVTWRLGFAVGSDRRASKACWPRGGVWCSVLRLCFGSVCCERTALFFSNFLSYSLSYHVLSVGRLLSHLKEDDYILKTDLEIFSKHSSHSILQDGILMMGFTGTASCFLRLVMSQRRLAVMGLASGNQAAGGMLVPQKRTMY